MDKIETFNYLFKLQEYQLILKESQIVHGKISEVDIQPIKQKIQEVRSQLSEGILEVFDNKGIHREVKGHCNGCHVSITKGDLVRLTKLKTLPQCPFCKSLLYLESFQ